jgi:hypothetical protein
MAGSGIFLDYHGHPDCLVLDSLLMKLRKTSEFGDLHATIRKRTYSLLVECMENIIKHSALKNSKDPDLLPYVSISDEDDRIIISARNPVREESISILTQSLNNVNNLDVPELRKLHEIRINRESDYGDNGAGLGFICIAFKSGNKINYEFHPLIPGYLNFEIQISLNKNYEKAGN